MDGERTSTTRPASRTGSGSLEPYIRQIEARDLAKTAVLIVYDLEEACLGGIRHDRNLFSVRAYGQRFGRLSDVCSPGEPRVFSVFKGEMRSGRRALERGFRARR